MKTHAPWLLAASLLFAAPAVAQETPVETNTALPTADEAAIKKQVETLLSGIERVATAQDWARIGEPAVPALIEIMRDRDAKVVKRGRAAIGLGHFDGEASAQALRMVLIDASSPKLLLRKSMIALAKIEGEAAVDAIAVHLDHEAKRVREQAIKSLGELRTESARAALSERVKNEPSKYLKDIIATELQKPVAASTTPTEQSGTEVARETAQ